VSLKKKRIKNVINKREVEAYSSAYSRANILKKIKKIFIEIRDFVGFKKEAIKWK
jgi:hypothetical protein